MAEPRAFRGWRQLNSEETRPDISRADFVFCMAAITWSWSVDKAADLLMEASTKAQTAG
jgi:hypothetical protein